MKGDDRVRFCGLCKKNVYDFSRLSEDEIRALLARESRVCARLWRRPDGKLLTADCPVGLARARKRLVAAVLTVASFILGFMGTEAYCGESLPRRFTMGALAAPKSLHPFVPEPTGPEAERLALKRLESFGQNNAP